MIRFFNWFSDLVLFDPSRWPHRELLSRIAAIILVAAFIYSKVDSFFLFPGSPDGLKLFFLEINRQIGTRQFAGATIWFIWGLRLTIWLLETGILVLYVVAYVSRFNAVNIAKGFMEVVFPFIVAVIPIIISFAPYNFSELVPYDSKYYILYYAITASLMIIGGGINLIGLFTLRTSFTIMSEARALITHGIFRFVRHPLYLGHFIMFLGSLCLRLHAYTVLMYIAFAGGQMLRARIEEKKLMAAFPDYIEYKNRTPMFFPLKLLIQKQK